MNTTGLNTPDMPTRTSALAALAGAFLVSCLLFLAPVRSMAGTATVNVEGVPGGVVVETREVVAKVVEIDKAKRTAKLQDETGRTFEAKAGPAAVNFDQVLITFFATVARAGVPSRRARPCPRLWLRAAPPLALLP